MGRIMDYIIQIIFVVGLITLTIMYLPNQFKNNSLESIMIVKNVSQPSENTDPVTVPTSHHHGHHGINNCRPKDGKLHLLENSNAKCIDGSQPGYYLRRGKSSSKWHIHFEGGGWCYTIEACFNRSQERLGSSKGYQLCNSAEFKDYLSSVAIDNPLMYSWNHVLVKYCDGASYAGDAIREFQGKSLYFKGKHNRDETILNLLYEHGMANATDVVISGCSAGGLGIYMGIDQMTRLILNKNPGIKVRALSDSGYFPDYTSDENWVTESEYPEALIGDRLDYSKSMKHVFEFQNVSSGTNQRCIRQNSLQPELCIFPENLAPHITTPIFSLQSRFDHWVIWHILGRPFNNSVVNQFGLNITRSMNTTLLASPRNNVYIDSCVHHCTKCSTEGNMWHGGSIKSSEGFSEADAFEWWYSLNSVSASRGTLFLQDGVYPCLDCCKCVI